ncbi:MAG: 5'-nucleotidase C-terminal domain-containing protein, partial [Pseudomonadota bacterium]
MTTLQILHASDLEGGVDAIVNAPNFAAVVDALETDAAESGISSILLSAGDNYIPGPFFNAAGDSDTFNPLFEGFYNEFFGLIDVDALDEADDTDGNGYFDNSEIQAVIEDASRDVAFEDVYVLDVNGDGVADYFEEIDNFEGRVDISIMNILGFDASAVGNHEFDAGTDSFENTINYDSEEGNSLSSGRYGTVNFLQEVDWPGVQFPYLTANLDFSEDFDVGPLFTSEILPNTDFESDLTSARVDLDNPAETGSDSNDSKIAPATLIERDGEQIGVVGATTQLIASISSTGNIDDVSSPGTNDMAALAAVLQPVVDDLIAAGSNKIILVSHLQQFALEQELATLLDGVDVIIAGGSDTILADETDVLRTEDQGGDFLDYPFLTTDLSGNPVAVVSTDGEYSYVGRLVLEFDDDGVLIPESIDSAVSGAFATDEAGVIAATGAATVEEAIAGSDKATDVQLLVDAASGVVTELDSDIAGNTEIFIEGRRQFVRTEQTTLGDLTADANLAAAQDVDETITVSLKNGGGIRAAIGETDADGNLLPTQENPVSGKEEGEISRLDIQNSLRFDNGLTALTVTSEGLKIILEHAVSASAPGATPGQFPQVGGINFSFDPNGTAQELDDDGNVVVEGTRVQSIVLLDEDGNPATTIAQNGEVFDSAPTAIRLVTLDFLVGDEGDLTGGDGYPFRALGENVVDLEISEQDALFDFLTANNATADEAFDTPELSTSLDGRIQQLDDRSDAAGAPTPTGELSVSIAQVFQGESDPEDEDSPEGASEVVSFSDGSLFVTNGNLGRIDIFDLGEPVMLEAVADGIVIEPLLTIGETLPDTSGALNATTAGDYTPVGILDGLGAYELNETTVRVFANHELLNFRGTPYEVSDGQGGTFEMLGARVSYFDIDKETMEITDGGIAYNTIVDANGNVASDTSFLPESFATNFGGAPGDGVELSGFSRFCSSVLVEAGQFEGRGLADRIYFAGEEDGGGFSSVGGAEWALDVATGIFYQVPAMGRGAWENVTELDTGTETHVAFILADDSSPFNADDFGAEEGGDDEVEAAPLFLYVGEKDTAEDAGFLARNGLEGGTLYVWVADAEGVDSPLEFNGAGNSEGGAFVAIDNSPNPDLASQDGSTGYDEYGYPTQRTLWQRAEDVGAFGFSRPEDVAFNPEDGSEFVLASTGVDTFDVDPATGNGADTFGTMYTMDVDFSDLENPTGTLEILYDGDEDATRALRSPDNLDWGDDGLIYVQEDEAEEDSLTGEPLFGEGAANPNE